MAAKKMEGRMDLMEEKMVEVQGELHREMGSVCGMASCSAWVPWRRTWEC